MGARLVSAPAMVPRPRRIDDRLDLELVHAKAPDLAGRIRLVRTMQRLLCRGDAGLYPGLPAARVLPALSLLVWSGRREQHQSSSGVGDGFGAASVPDAGMSAGIVASAPAVGPRNRHDNNRLFQLVLGCS